MIHKARPPRLAECFGLNNAILMIAGDWQLSS
jgi:hypothetical protein